MVDFFAYVFFEIFCGILGRIVIFIFSFGRIKFKWQAAFDPLSSLIGFVFLIGLLVMLFLGFSGN